VGLAVTATLGRTGVAAILVAVGVIVPCVAWYVVGSGAARQQAARMEAAPLEQARQEASRLAGQVGLRLEALRLSESRRPFEEYLTDDQLIENDCTRELAIRSPLSEGPVDPLIWAHFQIDDLGLVTLPSLGGPDTLAEGASNHDEQAETLEVAILEELECASADHLAALRRTQADGSPRRVSSGGGAITVRPFSWHTLTVRQQPALVAIREVTTPRAVLTQGFVVLSDSLDPLLAGGIFPASIRPGSAVAEIEAALAIPGDAWTISVDPAAAAAAAGAEARRVLARFRTTFAFGALAALLAGCTVVLLVWRTDRLAQERARFAAAAAHELRTPLAGLQLYGEMLADGRGDPGRTPEYARRVAEEAQRLGRVVTNMLGLSRLERGEATIRVEDGDLAQAVRDSVDRLRPAVESQGARVELEVADNVPRARFDRDALHHILQNLLDNAEKYGRAAEDRTIRVDLEACGDGPVLSVTDRGPGIPPAVRRRLFHPFARGAGDNAPGGLGIGLALVRTSAHAQGATVSHAEAAGGGSRFSVRFRAAR
jgi:signal transduction histidine kinase